MTDIEKDIEEQLNAAAADGATAIHIIIDETGEHRLYDVATRRQIPPEEWEEYNNKRLAKIEAQIKREYHEKRLREEWGEEYEWMKKRGLFDDLKQD